VFDFDVKTLPVKHQVLLPEDVLRSIRQIDPLSDEPLNRAK